MLLAGSLPYGDTDFSVVVYLVNAIYSDIGVIVQMHICLLVLIEIKF